MNQHVRVGVAVIIVNQDAQILVGKRKGSHGAGTWSVPGGHLEMGESIEACARREVLEETGLVLKSVSAKPMITNDVFSEDKHYITLWVTALIEPGATPQNLEPEKCEGWQWHYREDIPQPHFLGLANLIATYK